MKIGRNEPCPCGSNIKFKKCCANKMNLYIFEVCLEYDKSFSCKLQLSGEDTLFNLHYLIQEAYNWDYDHMFSFFMDCKFQRSNEEYSGNPTTDLTYEYAKTILDLMTREKDPKGRPKFLLVGGGIANFTDVAKTFTGITMALKDYKKKLKDTNVKIYVRRGGPNYQEGLRIMKDLGAELGIPIDVYGPETHMTRIVDMALGGK